MTRDKKLAVRGAARRAASLLTGALLIAGLAGCGNTLLASLDSSDASLTQKTKPSVAFSPVQGAPQKYAGAINDKLASSVKEKGVQVVDAKDAQYVIKTSYRAVPEPKKGTKVAYEIDVTDKTGTTVRKITGEEIVSEKRGGADSWAHVNDEAAQRVALKTATDVTAWIDNPNAVAPQAVASAPAASAVPATKQAPQKVAAAKPVTPKGNLSLAAATEPAAPAPAPAAAQAPAKAAPVKKAALPTEVVAMVPSVSAAPGDGKTALAGAMRKALIQQGVKLALSTSAQAYKVQGKVDIGAAANGTQAISIVWVVIDPAGKQVGTITQNNSVPEGRLDNAWGDIADQAAGAAAAEVAKLLNKGLAGQAQQSQDRSAG